jgi:hypothetical protein
MSASGRFPVVALVCLSNFWFWGFCLSSLAAAQQPDRVVAERVLGPRWKQLSRRAGMIFAGTVLAIEPAAATPTPTTYRVGQGTPPSVQLSFRVDRPIAGVAQGQIVAINEWAGAWAMQRPLSKGQHVLIFLYPPSRLGFSSPVGGSMGQVALDSSGESVPEHDQKSAAPAFLRSESPPRPLAPIANGSASDGSVSIIQLERAIHGAREE